MIRDFLTTLGMVVLCNLICLAGCVLVGCFLQQGRRRKGRFPHQRIEPVRNDLMEGGDL